ncbi:MAG: ygiD [Clostridia bacterium]|nr:ygiD [Clostridia bacterium]
MKSENNKKMPVLFIGHGSPMNAIETNPFTESLRKLGESFAEMPKAIMVVSAHWLTRGTFVSTAEKPEVIYDFYGFPKELYQVKYPAVGAPFIAKEIMKLAPHIKEDNQWGLDHGAWSILKHIFPNAGIPVFQLSIDFYQSMQYHFDLASELRQLREQGVLFIGSGNVVHNLALVFSKEDNSPFEWASEFDEIVKNSIMNKDFDSLINYKKFGRTADLAIPTVDHYVPLLYTLGMAEADEEITFTYEEVFTSLSMRCVRIG